MACDALHSSLSVNPNTDPSNHICGRLCAHTPGVMVHSPCARTPGVELHTLSVEPYTLCAHTLFVELHTLCAPTLSVELHGLCAHILSVELHGLCAHTLSVEFHDLCAHTLSVEPHILLPWRGARTPGVELHSVLPCQKKEVFPDVYRRSLSRLSQHWHHQSFHAHILDLCRWWVQSERLHY